MLFKFFIILQFSVACWIKIEVLSEFLHENDDFSDKFENLSQDTEKNESFCTVSDIENHDNIDFNATLIESTATVENLKVKQISSEALKISWTVTSENVTAFIITWFIKDTIINNATYIDLEASEQTFNYLITKLDACVEYKIIVTPFVSGSVEGQEIFARTTETQPGAPLILTADPCQINDIPALNISWEKPKVGGHCVDKYSVSIQTKIHDKRHFFTRNTSDTNIIMEDLCACSSYFVTVKAIIDSNRAVFGLPATIQSKPTSRKPSEKPRLISGQTIPPFIINITSITFNWHVFDEKNNCTLKSLITECQSQYSRPDGYGYDLKDGAANRTIYGTNKQKVKITVENLSPYTFYLCYGKIVNEGGTSEKSTQVWVSTAEDAPSTPQNLKLINESTLIAFTWQPPAYMPGLLQKYRLIFSWIPRYAVPDFCKVKCLCVDDDIHGNEYTWKFGDGFSDYKVGIAALTAGGWSQNNTSISFQTYAKGVPDEVTKLRYETKPRADDPNVLQTTLSWRLPCSLRGHLKHFEVFVFGTKNHLANHTMRDTVDVPHDYDKNMRFSIVLGELRPQHFYKFYVSATIHEANETGKIAVYETEYPAGIPPVPNKADMIMITLTPNKMQRTATSVEVLLPLFNNTNGDIKFYAIIVSKLGFEYERAHKRFNLDDENAWPNISSWKEAMEKNFEIPYQVTEPRWRPYPNYVVNYGSVKAVKYVIGEDVTCHALITDSRLYCNGPLEPDTTYQVWMRAFTNGGYADSDYILVITDKKMSIYLIIGVVLGILMVGIAAAVLLTKMSQYKGVKNPYLDEESDLERYRRNRQQPINSNPCGRESVSHAPIRTR